MDLHWGAFWGAQKEKKYKTSWNLPLRANIYADKQEKAVNIIAKWLLLRGSDH